MIETLRTLALMNATRRVLKISSRELAERIGQSLQTAARRLKELEERGWIERNLTKDGQFIIITDKGLQVLYREYIKYRRIFEGEKVITLRGRVFSGVGEGRYYVSLPEYRRQFSSKLGFDPFPGTLNLRVLKEDMHLRRRLDQEDGIIIEGFSKENRTFGEVKAFKCEVFGITSAVVLPKRTHYPPNILEIISPIKLRDTFNLCDGDIVEVKVHV